MRKEQFKREYWLGGEVGSRWGHLSTYLREPDFSDQLLFLQMSLSPFPGKLSQVHLVNVDILGCGKSQNWAEGELHWADTTNHLVN